MLQKTNLLIVLLTVAACGCGAPADQPNLTVTAPKDPAAIKVLDQIKALPTAQARRDFMFSHQAETQALRNDPGAWVEGSKLAYSDLQGHASSLDSASKKSN